MNILITGGKGFIGSSLQKGLCSKYNFFSLEREISEFKEKKFFADLTDSESSKEVFEEIAGHTKIDIIIHGASILGTPNNYNKISSLLDNLKITENLIEGVKILRPSKLIHLSSISVYPNENGIFSEESKVQTSKNTECLYGLSKICAENLLDFFLNNSKIKISHLRLAQVFGENMREDRIYAIMKTELKKFNRITVFGEGERVSNFISKNIDGTYNIGAENLSYMELAQRIIAKYGNPDSSIEKIKEGSRAKFYLDTAKIENLWSVL